MENSTLIQGGIFCLQKETANDYKFTADSEER